MSSEKYFPDENWNLVRPDEVNMDMQKLLELDDVIKKHYCTINGVVISRRGYMVYERYYNGFNNDHRHQVASVTKSIISALIGICIDKGYIEGVDKPVMDYFLEYDYMPDFLRKSNITIEQLLTMTAPFPFKNESLDRLRRQKNWVCYTISQLGRGNPRGKFQYNTAGVHLLSAVLTKASGLTAREFANKYLFEPIGMKPIKSASMKGFKIDDVFLNQDGWIEDPQGYTGGGWGLPLSPRDMTRIGLLYLNKGEWKQKTIVSKEWVEESITDKAKGYGYLWWLIEEDGINGYMAAGSGGNHIYCLPDLDLVISIASKITMKPKDRAKLLSDYIIPSVLDNDEYITTD